MCRPSAAGTLSPRFGSSHCGQCRICCFLFVLPSVQRPITPVTCLFYQSINAKNGSSWLAPACSPKQIKIKMCYGICTDIQVAMTNDYGWVSQDVIGVDWPFDACEHPTARQSHDYVWKRWMSWTRNTTILCTTVLCLTWGEGGVLWLISLCSEELIWIINNLKSAGLLWRQFKSRQTLHMQA